MSEYSYHLVQSNFFSTFKWMLFKLSKNKVAGLVHAEIMSAMTLGSTVFSRSRILMNEMVVFAQWENEDAIDLFLKENSLGKKLSKGWYVKLSFMRKWGHISHFEIPQTSNEDEEINHAVVAVTIARMKFLSIPRFLKWGRPVEKLVRDHPGTSLSLASICFPNTISTFSIWGSIKDMRNMVLGKSEVPQPRRHIDAMGERDRKDFHYEFTTLRFKPLAEYGEWKGKRNVIPQLNDILLDEPR